MNRTLAITLALMVTACSGGGDSGSSDSSKTGYLTFDGIAGLSYRTASKSGVTDKYGRFKYKSGETITFYLGDIIFAQDIPTKPYITIIDFDPDLVDTIDQGTLVRGLTDHTPLVEDAAEETHIVNMTRLLNGLSYPPSNQPDNEALIVISAEARSAVEAYTFSSPIDFYEDTGEFGDPELPDDVENVFINDICLAVENIQCRNDSVKEMPSVEQAETFATYQNVEITDLIASKVFLSPSILEINATDEKIYKVSISAVGYSLNITDLEVKSTDELPDSDGNFPDPPRSVAGVQFASADNKNFGVYATGEPGQETSVVANFKLAGDYRWFKKTLRVRLK